MGVWGCGKGLGFSGLGIMLRFRVSGVGALELGAEGSKGLHGNSGWFGHATAKGSGMF